MNDNESIKKTEWKFTVKDFLENGGNFQKTKYTDLTGVIGYDDTARITDMSNMFSDCTGLVTVPLLDTTHVTDMREMFCGSAHLTGVPAFDTSNVTDMSYMFSSCSCLTTVPAFDASNVTSMYQMFYNCSSLKEIHMKNIGVSLDISASDKFTRDALVEIIGNLQTVKSTKTLTMGSANLAKLTDEDKVVAKGKGWLLN